MQSQIKIILRLSAMSFLEFAVWGAYLTSMSNYMGSAGLGMLIPWFFAIQGLVCLITPPVIGILADRYIAPVHLLSACQLMAGVSMGMCWWLGYSSPMPDKVMFTVMYTLSSAFFMPTVALSNTIAFRVMRSRGIDTVKGFPRIRVWGTIGFICAMVFVNFASLDNGSFTFTSVGTNRFQFEYWQFLVAAIISLMLAVYSFTLPYVGLAKSGSGASLADKLGFNALGIFRNKQIVVFFIFSILMGMCVKVTNAYAGPFITSFMADPEFATSFGASNATLLTSISQVSEACCILLIPFFMKRYGVKVVLAISMVAWALRFGSFGLGNPGEGLWLLIFSMIVYGVAFDFFNIAGAVYLERETDKSITASAQGLWMMMSNGIGASVGTVLAGYVVEHYCHWQGGKGSMAFLVGDWSSVWYAFAAFAAVVSILFILIFRTERQS